MKCAEHGTLRTIVRAEDAQTVEQQHRALGCLALITISAILDKREDDEAGTTWD